MLEGSVQSEPGSGWVAEARQRMVLVRNFRHAYDRPGSRPWSAVRLAYAIWSATAQRASLRAARAHSSRPRVHAASPPAIATATTCWEYHASVEERVPFELRHEAFPQRSARAFSADPAMPLTSDAQARHPRLSEPGGACSPRSPAAVARSSDRARPRRTASWRRGRAAAAAAHVVADCAECASTAQRSGEISA